MLFLGFFTLVSVVWYSVMIVQDFFSFETQDNLIKYELGPTLFVGYISTFLSLLAGLVTCCLPGPKSEDHDYRVSKPVYSVGGYRSTKTDIKPLYGKSEKTTTMEYV